MTQAQEKTDAVLSYGGYYSTGGSIVRDILRETEPRIDFATEFRLLKEKGGLFDLYKTICEHYAPENTDLALKEFEWLMSNFSKPSGFLRKTGLNYQRLSGGIFDLATKRFVESLVDYTYPMSWHYQRFQANYPTDVAWQVKDRFFTRDRRGEKGRVTASMVTGTKAEIEEKFATYLKELIRGIRAEMDLGSEVPLGLHNSIPPFSYELIDLSKKFIPNLKLVITDRDPRDVYLNYPKDSYSRYLQNYGTSDERVLAFCRFYKSIRAEKDAVANRDDTLFLNMEDLCFSPDKYISQVFEFIDVDPSAHRHKGKFFDPNRSKKNIGMWQHLNGELKRDVDIIEEELKDFLYDY